MSVCSPLKMQLFSRAALLLFTQVSVCLCAPGANLTSNLDRIKIVFTPMVCRRVCSGGRCYNSCEKGDTTTVYSENQQHQPPKTQGFRLCECSPFSILLLSLHSSLFLCCLNVVQR